MNTKKVSFRAFFDLVKVLIFHIRDINDILIKHCIQIALLADFATWVV